MMKTWDEIVEAGASGVDASDWYSLQVSKAVLREALADAPRIRIDRFGHRTISFEEIPIGEYLLIPVPSKLEV